MYTLYNFLLHLYMLINLPKVAKRWFFEKGYKQRMSESRGNMPQEVREKIENKNAIWVHAASVGEVVATNPIVNELRHEFPKSTIVVSVVTATGYKMAKQTIKNADGIFYFPLDLKGATKRIIDIVKPSIILNVETEIWPNFIRWAKLYQIPLIMVNGRISEKSIKKYKKIRFFLEKVLRHYSVFCMQSKIDATHIKMMGAEPEKVLILGNTKYDQEYPQMDQLAKQEIQNELALDKNELVIIAGSTHPGEEEYIVEAFKDIKKRFSKATLIIAPRKITRGEELQSLCEESGFDVLRRSQMTEAATKAYDVIILDTIGELGKLYALADIVFVGGSLVEIGGHNILEPAAFGKPIVVGPKMFNFTEIYNLLSRNGACLTVTNQDELNKVFMELAENDEMREKYGNNAYEIMQKNQGAARRNVEQVRKVLKETNRLHLVGEEDN